METDLLYTNNQQQLTLIKERKAQEENLKKTLEMLRKYKSHGDPITFDEMHILNSFTVPLCDTGQWKVYDRTLPAVFFTIFILFPGR